MNEQWQDDRIYTYGQTKDIYTHVTNSDIGREFQKSTGLIV